MKQKKENKILKKPKFGGALIADNSRPQTSGKIDLHGVFTKMHAWGYPATRLWTMVLTIFDLPKIQTTLHVGIRRKGSKQIDTLATADLKDDSFDNAHTINMSIGYRFEQEGDYEIICTLKDYSSTLKIPLRVKTKEWPTFTESEISILEHNKSRLPHKVSAQVKCMQCEQHYVFEEKILPNENYSGGTIQFPENGLYECENCDHNLKLKDIQGQIRASIKDNLLQFIKSSSNV